LSQEAIQEEPNTSRNYDLLAVVYVSLGRYADVLRLCHDPLHGNTKSVGFHQACFDAAFASDDEVAMQRALQSVRGTAEESELIADSAWGAMYHGKLSQARMLFQKAEQTAKRSKVLDLEADIGLDEGMLEAEVGSRSIAEADVERILQLPFESASEQAYAARVLARSGDASKALLVANKAASTAPLDDLVNSAMLPTVTAAIKLQEANPKGALDALEPRDFDLCCRILVAGYYRGLAYLEMKQPELAKREFQNVIDHRFLSASFSIYLVLSELELGHVCQLLGDSANANAAFAKVDLAWKGADPSFPPLAKLRQYRGLPPLAK
jgi:tetratricopeptide (TPR) repeat protein